MLISCVSEVKPKKFSRNLSLVGYKINGFALEPVNILENSGRGMILYIKNHITYELIDMTQLYHKR